MDTENSFEVIKSEDTVSPENIDDKNCKKPKVSKEVFDWIDTVVAALIAVVVIFTFLFRIATIEGPSMQNTLYSGERVVISNLFYEPQYGDIVVISRNTDNSVKALESGNEPIIKRVIATEHQYVDIDFIEGKVYVGPDLAHMTMLDEPYAKTLTTRQWDVTFPLYVEEGHIFVLGDNRNDSMDSRSSAIGNDGLIDKRYILGKAIVRIWPFDAFGGLYSNE